MLGGRGLERCAGHKSAACRGPPGQEETVVARAVWFGIARLNDGIDVFKAGLSHIKNVAIGAINPPSIIGIWLIGDPYAGRAEGPRAVIAVIGLEAEAEMFKDQRLVVSGFADYRRAI